MIAILQAARALGRRLHTLPASSPRDRGAQLADLERCLGWAAPVGAAFAMLAAAAGATFRERPTLLGALALVAAVAMVSLVFRGVAIRILTRLHTATTERRDLEAELDSAHRKKEEFRDLAYHDPLTGLPNRSLLLDRLGLAITQSRRRATRVAVLYLDLDDFKTVNDSLGHDSGDRLLVELATRVRRSVRAGDTVARFGGDEFIVLLDSVTGADDTARVAAKVLDAVRAPFPLDGHEVSIAASLGVSVYPGDGTSPDELLRSADAAMYRDKQRSPALGAVAISRGAASARATETERPLPGELAGDGPLGGSPANHDDGAMKG